MERNTENLSSNSNTEKRLGIIKMDKKTRKALSKIKRRVFKHVWIIRIAILSIIAGLIYLLFILTGSVLKKSGIDYYLTLVKDFILTPTEKIESIADHTNILILGKGGIGHEAPDLTDTVILVSVNHKSPAIDLISLPRDIWIPELRAKLNSTYYWGNKKKDGGGLVLTKSSVEKIVGLPVQYGIVLDFNGFREIINILGGIEVEVENGFIDDKYPIPGREADECNGDPDFKCRYETIIFERGKHQMDGELALKFVRSRNAEGDEGTDFARSARQQKAISAIKDKILTKKILFNYQKLRELRDVVVKYTETDIDIEAVAILTRRFLQSKDSISSYVLPEDLLVNPPISPQYDNLYVFTPKAGDWSEVHRWTDNILEK